jgi:1-acyl-sn-glycerol-3-phosphate acyltransferase
VNVPESNVVLPPNQILKPDCGFEAPRTPAWAPVRWLGRVFPSLVFYPQMGYTVWHGSSLSTRNLYTDAEWVNSSLGMLRGLESVGVKLDVQNIEAFARLDQPAVFIGNHMSTLETFVLPCIIRPHRPVTFVIKQSLLDYPVFKHLMRSRNPIAVGRSNPREDLVHVMEGGIERLKHGVSIILFPQTTRTTEFDPKHFNSIGVKLARRAGVPVVPIALKTDAWTNGRFIKDFGPIRPERPVHIHFGEPFLVEGNGKEEHERIVEFIQSKLEIWRQQDGESLR